MRKYDKDHLIEKYDMNPDDAEEIAKIWQIIINPKMNRSIRLRELRETTGLSQKAFAEYLHIPKRTYEQWESGNRNPPEYVVELIDYRIMKEIEEEEEGHKSKKYYVTLIKDYAGIVEEDYLLRTDDKDYAIRRAMDEAFYIKRDGRSHSRVEIRMYKENIEDDDCTCFGYDVLNLEF